jgi:hypothetical protein
MEMGDLVRLPFDHRSKTISESFSHVPLQKLAIRQKLAISPNLGSQIT